MVESTSLTGTLISIHAPLTGCDSTLKLWRQGLLDFNPRTPHGVRLAMIFGRETAIIFQSTHPSRGATLKQFVSNHKRQ